MGRMGPAACSGGVLVVSVVVSEMALAEEGAGPQRERERRGGGGVFGVRSWGAAAWLVEDEPLRRGREVKLGGPMMLLIMVPGGHAARIPALSPVASVNMRACCSLVKDRFTT